MAKPANAPLVKLICGMISADASAFARSEAMLAGRFGPVDLSSEVMPFDFTHYYDQQMGTPLLRRFVSFSRLVPADVLIEAKRFTNDVEAVFEADVQPGRPARPVNLDPGYVDSSKLILASMKDFSHRIYLGQGVFGEVTLQWRGGRWRPLPWTFPDYASLRYDGFLSAVRGRLRDRRKPGDVE